ncbi:MAG: hypothetical protein HYR94_14240 [Chloroflexi bacterium]|nr:hypothetical protein [Chloroflexota bacterium]
MIELSREYDLGVSVVLGTGRATEAYYDLLRHLNLDELHIFFDGAAVFSGDFDVICS